MRCYLSWDVVPTPFPFLQRGDWQTVVVSPIRGLGMCPHIQRRELCGGGCVTIVTWKTGFDSSKYANSTSITCLGAHLGCVWGGEPIFWSRLWRKDSIKRSVPTVGLFNRDGTRGGEM